MTDPCCLIGDIGGTYVRFALADQGKSTFKRELTVPCKDYKTAEFAIIDYLERMEITGPQVICLAVAGLVVGDRVRMTNNHWNIDCHQLHKQFPAAKIRLINDFEAIACSIPLLSEADLMTIGPEPSKVQDKTSYTIAVLGPGTGLGVAGLLVREDKFFPIAGEGGHVGFAPENALQVRVLEELRQRFERVSNERLLSGPGLENVYRAMRIIRGEPDDHLSVLEIFQRGLSHEDACVGRTLQLFYEVLGQVAGNLALQLGAFDGIYIAGGIVKRYPALLESSNFRSGFDNKGRYRSLMEKIPTRLVMHPNPGLLGAAYLARQMSQP